MRSEEQGGASAPPQADLPLAGGLVEFVEAGKAKRAPPPPKPKAKAGQPAAGIADDRVEEWIAKAAQQRKPASSADEIATVVEEAQAQIAAAASQAPFDTDPYGTVLAGLSCTIGVLPKVVRRQEDSISTLAVRLDGFAGKIEAGCGRVAEVAAEAKHPVLAADQVGALAAAAKKGAVEGAWRTARELRMRHIVVAACVAAGSVAVIGPAAWFGGRAAQRTEVAAWAAATRADVAGLSLPAADAAAWAKLIRDNPPIGVLLAQAVPIPNERRGKAVALSVWTDLPKPATPGGR
jgi:hypothetical protein